MLNTNQFDFDKDLKQLFADASDLRVNFGKEFLLKSAHTNQVVKFRISRIYRDFSDEDIMFWKYIPDTKLNNLESVVIFND